MLSDATRNTLRLHQMAARAACDASQKRSPITACSGNIVNLFARHFMYDIFSHAVDEDVPHWVPDLYRVIPVFDLGQDISAFPGRYFPGMAAHRFDACDAGAHHKYLPALQRLALAVNRALYGSTSLRPRSRGIVERGLVVQNEQW